VVGKLLLLRVYLDAGSLPGGGYYSPLWPGVGCATLIPVPEAFAERATRDMDPASVVDPCTGRPLLDFLPVDRWWLLHNDPRLDLGFYTDYYAPRGRLPRSLAGGDVVGFVAGLAVYPEGFWSRRRSLPEIRRALHLAAGKERAAVHLVGFLEVEEVVDTARTGWGRLLARHPQLRSSPHYARHDDYPTAVIGRGYLVYPPAPLSEPRPWLARQPPSRLLARMLGEEAAWALARGNYRRSRLARLDAGELREVLEEAGYSARPA